MKSGNRQRVSVACMACRAKRMRCDGKEPVCDACVKRGIDCVYQHGENKRRPPSKKYVESLQARIQHLESQLMTMGTSRIFPWMGPELVEAEPAEEVNPDSGNENSDHDPMSELTGLVGRIAVVDDGQLHYFGSQSSFNLPKQPDHPAAGGHHDPWLRMQNQGLNAAGRLNLLTNVSPELEDHLLDLYWRWQNPWNYIVHKGAFLRSRRGQDNGRHCSPLLLSTIFAIAARYSDRIELRTDPNDPSTSGHAFCEQAKILLLYESEAPSVTTVQAAAILALRIMSDGKEALGWLYCGSATRMAHSLGLHVDCSTSVTAGLITEDEAEVRKVAWWGCFVVDKLFACGLGRPSSIQKSGVTCPKPTIEREDEYIPWLPGDSPDQAPALGAHSHIASCSHFVSECMAIACEALEIIYAPNSRLSFQDIEGIVSKADVDLRAYYNTLPSYLRLPSSPKTPTLPHLFLAHIQYHTHLVLLHRPLIRRIRNRRPTMDSSATGDTSTAESEGRYFNQHMEICRHSAAQISKLMHIYKKHYTLRQIPIAAVHLSFAAAVIHLIDAHPASPYRAPALRNLQICVDSLKDLRVPWCAWADRSLRGVQLLASNWYRCGDVSQLKIHNDQIEEDESPQPPHANDYGVSPGTTGFMKDGTTAALGSWDSGEFNLPEWNVPRADLAQPNHPPAPNTTDAFASLFQNTGTESDMDDLVKDWLANSAYDWICTDFATHGG